MSEKNIWIIILAAGYSRRMGEPKLLLPLPDGKPLITRVAGTACRAKASGVVLVYNADVPAVADAVAEFPLVPLANDESRDGMSSSLKAGIHYVKERNAEAAIILLGDQPDMEEAALDQLIELYEKQRYPIIQTVYRTTRSHPVLFSRSFFPELLTVTGDQGARQLIRQHQDQVFSLHVTAQLPEDIDTREEYQSYLQRIQRTDEEG
ncbi:nucleotidyltransferase family protein [Alkalihalobacillus oceani]|uniref:Nucleotidyltransferase family protein n=1 Tax=Halalkalibacter oceani TaxID=1653776 RepID=A0A9X2DPU1_9BACI|nr:nucleotidyltransferase family protein [Halalkalibacter oceani]MCM3714258.1 nucleotidyltransferase family protein [Halalkalibacter oceani]